MVELAGGSHGGDDENRAGDHALAAACGRVAHGQVALALALGEVGGGAALVELDGRHAAERDHHAGLFLGGVADGAGGHGAVCLEQDDRAVGLDADAGARVIAAVAGLGGNDLAIPDHGDERVDRLDDLNGLALLFTLAGLGLRKGRALAEDVDGAVVKRGEEGAAGVIVMHDTVHHEIAGGLAGVDVEPRGVDAADDVQARLPFVDVRLLGRGLQRPAKLLRVAVAVTGYNFRPSLIRVDLHDVGNGLGVARVVVRDNHGLGNIRRDGVVFLGNNVVSGTGNFAALIQFGTQGLLGSTAIFCDGIRREKR